MDGWSWSAAGVLWSAAGVLLECCWSGAGVLLECCWSGGAGQLGCVQLPAYPCARRAVVLRAGRTRQSPAPATNAPAPLQGPRRAPRALPHRAHWTVAGPRRAAARGRAGGGARDPKYQRTPPGSAARRRPPAARNNPAAPRAAIGGPRARGMTGLLKPLLQRSVSDKQGAPAGPGHHRWTSVDSLADLTQPVGFDRVERVAHEVVEYGWFALRLWSFLGLGWRWAVNFWRLVLFATFLLPGFLPMIWYYVTSPRVTRSVPYGRKERQRLDLFIPKAAETTPNGVPVVIFVTGGAWTIGYKAWGALLGRRLCESGVLCACLDYRNFPQASPPRLPQLPALAAPAAQQLLQQRPGMAHGARALASRPPAPRPAAGPRLPPAASLSPPHAHTPPPTAHRTHPPHPPAGRRA
jgi:hypothetical protein